MAGERNLDVTWIHEDCVFTSLSTSALSWPSDHLILFRCGFTVHTFSLVPNRDLKKLDVLKVTAPSKIPDLSSSDSFCVGRGCMSMQPSIVNLSEGEKLSLTLDQNMLEDFYMSTKEGMCVRQVAVSSCHSGWRCMAVVTNNHRVMMYTQSQQLWTQTADLFPVLKSHFLSELTTPVTLGEDLTLDQYRKLLQTVSTTALAWSDPLSHNGVTFDLLFTGMKGGQLYVWSIEAIETLEEKDSIKFEAKDDEWLSQISTLAWLKQQDNTGLLAVGYADSNVRILNVTTDGQTWSLSQVFADGGGDRLSVGHLQWSHLAQTDHQVLVASKQYFLVLYSLTSGQWQRVTHVHLSVAHPINAFQLDCDGLGIVSSSNNQMFTVHCTSQEGNEKPQIQLGPLTCGDLPYTVHKSDCLGAALSPNGLLLISTHRVKNDGTKGTIKYPRIGLHPIPELSLQSLLGVLRKPIRSGSCQDMIIYQRLVMLELLITPHQDVSAMMKQVSEVIKSRNDRWSLYLLRDLYLYVRTQLDHLDPRSKDLLSSMESSSKKITEQLISQHIHSCLGSQDLSEEKQGSKENQQNVVNAMKAWCRGVRPVAYPPLVSLMDTWTHISLVQPPQCPLCQGNLTQFDELHALCAQQCMKIALCCVSLLPCSGADVRQCLACGHPAVSLDTLAGVTILPDKWTCMLCAGPVQALAT